VPLTQKESDEIDALAKDIITDIEEHRPPTRWDGDRGSRLMKVPTDDASFFENKSPHRMKNHNQLLLARVAAKQYALADESFQTICERFEPVRNATQESGHK
jgi:hypothetical protein